MPSKLPTSFVELMQLERLADTYFLGQSPDYEWGRVFGGQVVAQALRAAYATIEANHRVHSVHAYFVRGGVPKEPILFDVDPLRDGRSFTTRRVVARQQGGAILNLDASFQVVEDDHDIQQTALAADVPPPDSVEPMPWSAFGELREISPALSPARSSIWLRIAEDLGDDRQLHECGLAYLSDHNPMDAIVASYPGEFDWRIMMSASLDHSIWFHRHTPANEWILFDMRAHGLVNARGLAIGAVHSADGLHAATIAQEGLIRSPRT